MLIDLNREYGCGTDCACNSNSKQPNRPTPCDGDRLGGNFARQHGVNGIAKWIENRGVLQRDGGIKLPNIGFGNDDVLGEGPICIDANNLHVLADVSVPCAALQTFAASNVHLGRNKVAFLDAGHFVAECNDLTAKFVAWDQWRMNAVLRPAVPLVDVQIRPTDGGDFDFNQHIGAAEFRNLYFADVRTRCSFRLDHS